MDFIECEDGVFVSKAHIISAKVELEESGEDFFVAYLVYTMIDNRVFKMFYDDDNCEDRLFKDAMEHLKHNLNVQCKEEP